MFIGFVKRACAIEVFPSVGDVASQKQRTGNHPMPDRQRKCFFLLIRERQELSCGGRRRTALKCSIVPAPDAKKEKKQGERIFGWLSNRLCPLDQHSRKFECGLGLGRPIALG